MSFISDEIQSKINIVEFIGNYISLRKSGSNFRALCPFHNEKSPSFFVAPDRQIWHCFGCGIGGGAIKFYMLIENVGFNEAIENLAEKLGIEYKKIDKVLISQKKEIFSLIKEASLYFQKNLIKPENKEILSYLIKQRGLEKETIIKFHLGYASNSFDNLKKYLLSQGFKADSLKLGGLFIIKEDSTFYDRFRNRIMFPVFDLQDRIVGFSGRIFEPRLPKNTNKDDIAKYVNTSNNIIYNKSQVLYLLNFAKPAIKKNQEIILVEGNMDAIMSHQVGIENVAATSGTSLNADHLNIIKRFTDKIVFSFDNDEAGKLAKERAIKIALSKNFEVFSLDNNNQKDPADIIKQDPLAWQKIIKNKKEWLENLFETKLKEFPLDSIKNKKEFSKSILPFIKSLNDPIEKSEWIKKMSDILDIKEMYLQDALKSIKKDDIIEYERSDTRVFDENDTKPGSSQSRKLTKKELLEKHLLLIFIKYQEIIDDEIIQVNENDFLNDSFRELLTKIKPVMSFKKKFEISDLKEDDKEKYGYIFIEADALKFNLKNEQIKNEFEVTLIKLKREKIKTDIQELKKLIKNFSGEEHQKMLELLNQKIKELK